MISSTSLRQLVALVLAAAAIGACTAETAEAPKVNVVQPGAPGQGGKVLSADEVPRADDRDYTDADVRFMQGMIRHHSQALRMTALVAGRSQSKDLPRFAKRIEISQQDEIDQMVRWLRARLKEVPSVGSGAGHDHGAGALMPGMLTEEQFAELERAEGEQFDRLFYTYMIQHHMGALSMVEGLFDDGGGQEAEINQFVTHVDADQRIEIDRMRALLAAMDATDG
ncbi:hypothetical protein GCM10010116_14360 [Microbispora rosea subsp. aerata]|nr:DUF305 domain-containing protein [Microbispora rosea]GGO07179.1 hypothetical protein GCM10010116_14360 [Microbispora rosea subsp. aerata]GIH53136.1 hypothetical protein Mro02_00500 [Microbispora rosea subsp. aerata]GLJ83952.1 hypothetical protein GCM10017588_26800 [Microbispora rosea subsp. aerata]